MIVDGPEPTIRQWRCLSTWDVLIRKAREGETINYEHLAYESQVPFPVSALGNNSIVNAIYEYCFTHDLPPLAVLAVNMDTGEPGGNYPGDVAVDRAAVFGHDWWATPSPRAHDF